MRKWFLTYCNASKNSFIYRLYIHETADHKKAINNWAKILDVKPEQIGITFKRNIVKSRHQNDSYKGFLTINVRKGTWLNRRIELWTLHAANYYLSI